MIINGYKNNKSLKIKIDNWGPYKRSKVYSPITPDRIVGIDTETYHFLEYGAIEQPDGKWRGGERTASVQLAFYDDNLSTVINTASLDYPIVALFDYLFPIFAIKEERPSRTKQRARRERKDGTHRDGRKQYIAPIVLIAHNLEYDLGRLLRTHQAYRRALLLGEDSLRLMIEEYEVELVENSPFGSAPSFEWYVRRENKIIRLLGRDTWGYLKTSLKDAAKAMGIEAGKIELDEEQQRIAFDLPHEWLSSEQREWLDAYARRDPEVCRQLYLALVALLTQIDEHVICRNGLIPRSAPGAAAKIAWSMASVDEWPRPSKRVQEIGAATYCGARTFNRKPGYYTNLWVYDLTSAYPFAMTLLPDPATCEYRDVEPGSFQVREWLGKWGALCISGEGLDPYYPPLRNHDTEHERLRYIYGSFERVWSTIPEIVIGVISGRLRVDCIHDGTEMIGTSETSFLRRFVEKVYALKASSEKKSPMYYMAKLLMNSLYGKLVEIQIDKPALDLQVRTVELPEYHHVDDNGVVHSIKTELKPILQAYVERDVEGVEEYAASLFEQYAGYYDEERPIIVDDLVKRHLPNWGKAGNYYLPLHGSQITGLVSAMIGLAAHCTQAVQGHTDSIFVLGDATTSLERYRAMMEESGYPVPAKGLGSFDCEVTNASGYLCRYNLYAVRYEVDGEIKEKIANHGIVHVEKKCLYDLIEEYYHTHVVRYVSRPSPARLKASLRKNIEPGIFQVHERSYSPPDNPNTEINREGEIVWLPYSSRSSSPTNHVAMYSV